MKLVSLWVASTFLVTSCMSTTPPVTTDPAPSSVVREVDRLAALDLWPGFEAGSYPIAIDDGKQTWLFRHPLPGAGFRRHQPAIGVYVLDGRHPLVTANSTTEIDGALTATVIANEKRTPRELAALVVHELFHAYQKQKHPRWSANEVDLFLYPVDDPTNLAAQRLELSALQRGTTSREDAACWAASALDIRKARLARLDASSGNYERATELNEGLASYVEHRAIGTSDAHLAQQEVSDPAAVRSRSYLTGHLLARLLDRLAPNWKAELESDDTMALDEILERSLRETTNRCAFSAAERLAADELAAADAESIRRARSTSRTAFLGREGFRIVITTVSRPIFPQRFDPLNVQVIAPREVLHTRQLTLGNGADVIEILDRAALTEGVGPHPLFNGVRTTTITGLTAAPTIHQSDDLITIDAEGFTARFRRAAVDTNGKTIHVRVE